MLNVRELCPRKTFSIDSLAEECIAEGRTTASVQAGKDLCKIRYSLPIEKIPFKVYQTDWGDKIRKYVVNPKFQNKPQNRVLIREYLKDAYAR